MESDSIVAVVTPPGEGGVGIVRVSGPLSRDLPRHLFPGLRPPWETHRMRHGDLIDPVTGTIIDRALGCHMMGPHSYTGEDVFEVHCHGSPIVLERVMAACLAEGCRAAKPGEFTLRAFLNGRMDLTSAEAVLDVVRARTNAGLEMAVRQLTGWMSGRLAPIYRNLMGLLAHVEAMVDFVEDDIPPQLDQASLTRLDSIRCSIEGLLQGARQGAILREGASLAITGSPNVGKSSIMNALLGLERSIVTPIAGTTRDTVEEVLEVRGVPFRTVDTAGITDTEDLVESMGVERSRRALESADVALLVLDRSRPYGPRDELAVEAVESALNHSRDEGRQQRLVIVLNKADLPQILDPAPLLRRLQPNETVESSALQPDGIEQLRMSLERVALGGNRQEFAVGNVRHQDALRRCAVALQAARDGLSAGTPLDLVSLDIRAAAHALGEITGAEVDDDLLDRIFRDFCIGK